jgi:flagellar hook-length control protein FliK
MIKHLETLTDFAGLEVQNLATEGQILPSSVGTENNSFPSMLDKELEHNNIFFEISVLNEDSTIVEEEKDTLLTANNEHIIQNIDNEQPLHNVANQQTLQNVDNQQTLQNVDNEQAFNKILPQLLYKDKQLTGFTYNPLKDEQDLNKANLDVIEPNDQLNYLQVSPSSSSLEIPSINLLDSKNLPIIEAIPNGKESEKINLISDEDSLSLLEPAKNNIEQVKDDREFLLGLQKNTNLDTVFSSAELNNIDKVDEGVTELKEQPILNLQQLIVDEKINYTLAEKDTRTSINVNNLTNYTLPSASVSTNIQNVSASTSQVQYSSSSESGSFNQGQSSGQQQYNYFLKQNTIKLQIPLEQQAVLPEFKTKLYEVEKTDRILGNLGVGLDKKSELPLAMQSISPNIRSAKWSQELGSRLVYMVNKNIQEAKITISPEKLGPIQIKLNFDKEQLLHVTMVAQHGVTRELLENATPRLRELLENSNVNVVNVDVGSGKFFEQNKNESNTKQTGLVTNNFTDEEEIVSARVIHSSDNLIDYYA